MENTITSEDEPKQQGKFVKVYIPCIRKAKIRLAKNLMTKTPSAPPQTVAQQTCTLWTNPFMTNLS